MKNIVKWEVRGIRWRRDRDGTPIKGDKVQSIRGFGIAVEDAGLDGTIFRQCPDLIRCDSVQIHCTALA